MFEVVRIRTRPDGSRWAYVIWEGDNKKDYRGGLGCYLDEQDWTPEVFLMREKGSDEGREWLKGVTFYQD